MFQFEIVFEFSRAEFIAKGNDRVWKCTRRCISIDKTPLLTLCCQNVVVMIANFLRCVHQRHFLPGTGPGSIFLVEWQLCCVESLWWWAKNMIWYVYSMSMSNAFECIVNTSHHNDNDKSVWLWISGYDMLLIWIGFKSSKRNVMRYTCYVSSFCNFLLSFKTALMKLPLHHGISLCCFCIWKI